MHASGGPHGPYPDSAEPTMLTHRPAAAADSNPARAAPVTQAKLALAPPRAASTTWSRSQTNLQQPRLPRQLAP